MRAQLLAVAGAGATGLGGSVALGLLVPMEAGVPIPVPSDLVMFAVGERVSAGTFALWVVVVGLEVVALVGTTALFLLSRGPGHAVIGRLGPRFGLTAERLGRAGAFLEQRGRVALAVGRGTPGLRTVTVVAAGTSGLSLRRALPALVLGSSVFLQLHLVLGLLFGSLARKAFDQAKAPALAAAVVLTGAAVVFWLFRRGSRRGSQSWTEAACPACLALGLVADRQPALAALTGRERIEGTAPPR